MMDAIPSSPPSPTVKASVEYRSDIDPTITFLYRPYSITLLLVILLFFLWLALSQPSHSSSALHGLLASGIVFCFVGMLCLPNGPFIRPHPILWRAVLGLSIIYLLVIVFLMFISLDDARQLVAILDPSLGVSLPERSYATHCEFTATNIWNQLDFFIWAHVAGWYAKALILRDTWLCWILSVMFEVMEYSLEHQLPNFAECWWDHWILDVATCNFLGIWLGMRTCRYLEMKGYHWRGIRDIPTYSGKVRRTVAQFTPHSWTAFNWAASRTLKGYLVVVAVVSLFLMDELNVFYLKYLLWIPPPHWIVQTRVLLHALMGTVAVRETFQFFTDPKCKKLGTQAWIMIATICVETLLAVKWGRGLFLEPAPKAVKIFWAIFVTILVAFPVWKFAILPRMLPEDAKEHRSNHPRQQESVKRR